MADAPAATIFEAAAGVVVGRGVAREPALVALVAAGAVR